MSKSNNRTFRHIRRVFSVIETLFRIDCQLDYERALTACERLCELVADYDDDDTERLWSIGEMGAISLGDAIENIYWFGVHYANGQWSNEYRLSCVAGQIFSPGHAGDGPDHNSELYDMLSDMAGD